MTFLTAIRQFIFPFDHSINIFFLAHFPAWLVSAMIFFTYFVNPLPILIFELILITVLITVHKKYLAALFVSGLIVATGISVFLKNIFARARPSSDIMYHIFYSGYSFPSSHAVVATVVYGFFGFCLAHIAKRKSEKNIIIICTAILVFLIGFSRVFLGVHYASDVMAGWVVGGVILYFLILAYNKIHKKIYGH